MMVKKCFVSGCMNEAEYACKCSSPETLLCGEHIGEHVNSPSRAHNLDSIFMQPCEGTKEAILEFLTKETSKCSELRRKITDSFSQRLSNSDKDLGDFTSKLDCYSDEINDLFAKISQASKILKSEQDPILGLLILQPQEAIEKVNLMTITNRDWYNGAKLFYIFNQKLESLNRSFFTEICGVYLEKRNMQNIPEIHDKASKPTNIDSANVDDSISLIINENSESLKGSENVNKPIKQCLESATSLLNSQISTVSNDFNSKSNETENASNIIDTLRNKTAEILRRPNNPELEIDFRTTCSAIQANSSFYDPQLMQAYQDYLKAYKQKTSLYNIRYDDEKKRTMLFIYSTENETEEVKILKTPKPLNLDTCIAQLPNGKLFCYNNDESSRITVLINVNGGVEVLPSGVHSNHSSCIYFNNSVYCFGGKIWNRCLTLSSRFDLDQNRWIQLTPMPKDDYECHSILFNGNILISGYDSINLLLYSIDIDSFSTIPYEFAEMKRKILINAGRLYLIECKNGSIYESEIESYSNWKRIGRGTIDVSDPIQASSYNKGGICISITDELARVYYHFNLDQKFIIDIAYYNKHVSLKRVGKKIEAIKCKKNNFELDPYYLDECNAKDWSLSYLGAYLEDIECLEKEIERSPNDADLYVEKAYCFNTIGRWLEAIECYDKAIKLKPNYDRFYRDKGDVFYNIKRYLEAIECYNEAIKLNPKNDYYNNKGLAFSNLGKYLEAIECYDKLIEFNPKDSSVKYNKGSALFDLGRYPEALECYDQVIKLNPNRDYFYWKKGSLLNKLGRYPEALENYDEAIKIQPCIAYYYFEKSNALYVLERYQEAIQCYDEAIKLEPSNPLYFCLRARAYNNLRQEEAALQDLNMAYKMEQENQVSGFFIKKEFYLSEENINFINDALGRDRIELLQKMQI